VKLAHRAVGGTAAFALAAVASACGSGSHVQSVVTGEQEFAAAYSAAQSHHTADVAMTLGMTDASEQQVLSMTGSGAFQFKPLLGELNLDEVISGQHIAIGMDMVGTNIYMKLPAAAQAELGGKEWLKIDIAQLLPGGASSGFDPSQELELLTSQADSITKAGTAVIDGVDTTRYNAEMDLSKAYGSAKLNSVQQELETQYRAMAGTYVVPISVWIDAKGLPRRMEVQEDLVHPPAGSASAVAAAYPFQMSITETMSNYGVHVAASAPPASEVSSMTFQQLLQLEQQDASGANS
jgi:hypothetical protein